MAEPGGGTFAELSGRWLCAAATCGMILLTAAWAEAPAQRLARQQPSLAPDALLSTFASALNDGPTDIATAMIRQGGLADLVHLDDHQPEAAAAWAVRPTSLPEAQTLNLRLALTMLSQAYGTDDVSDVLAAQPSPDQPALVIRKGTATLADLRRILRTMRLQQVSDSGPLELRVPLVIWSGAALHLQKDEVLHLNRADGAFLINFGLMQLSGATIAATTDPNLTSQVFVPFVTTADGGVMQASGARFHGLGFGRTAKFSGLAIMQGTIHSPRQPSWIENSVFEELATVSISMARDMQLRGNHFSNMRATALKVSRTMGARIVLNIFSGRMRTNAIMIEDGATDALVAGNVVLGGKRAGIVVRASSTGAQVIDNVIWRRDGGGIAVIGSDCGVVAGNLVIKNAQKGIEVRSSLDAAVTGNSILNNHSAGLWVSAQKTEAMTFVRDNLLAENGAGVAAAAGASLLMEGNDFSYQFQQFLSGDLATQTTHMARDMRGAAAIILTAGGPLPATRLSAACSG